MKLARFGEKGSEKPAIVDEAGKLRDISNIVDDIDGNSLANGLLETLKGIELAELPVVDGQERLAEPVGKVGNFICVGLNYSDHIKESGMDTPAEPVLFLKAVSSIIGPYDEIVLPKNSSKVDWEVELGVVIGKRASYVSEEEAMNYVAGLCVVDDVSERSFQLERSGQWTKGKGCPTFGPFGPWLVTLDEVDKLDNLNLWLDVNNKRMQTGNTGLMVFKIPHLVHYISQFMVLEPGDLISTGTPPGVGAGMNPQAWLKKDDVVELGIDGLGSQRHDIVPFNG
ncbi:MAG: fumarylacetoacetate hydrolase family protein [Gammaproteobacteria bacterium]